MTYLLRHQGFEIQIVEGQRKNLSISNFEVLFRLKLRNYLNLPQQQTFRYVICKIHRQISNEISKHSKGRLHWSRFEENSKKGNRKWAIWIFYLWFLIVQTRHYFYWSIEFFAESSNKRHRMRKWYFQCEALIFPKSLNQNDLRKKKEQDSICSIHCLQYHQMEVCFCFLCDLVCFFFFFNVLRRENFVFIFT